MLQAVRESDDAVDVWEDWLEHCSLSETRWPAAVVNEARMTSSSIGEWNGAG